MFEISLALKYLIPRRARLSASLIALLSVGVISLVVWLILVFLSITEGIERGWLHKLTALNAPVRITPTSHYYDSYYYQIDSLSQQSHYTLKTLAEKKLAALSDPYRPCEDEELPLRFPLPEYEPDGSLRDPVKGLFVILESLKEKEHLAYQDFELSGALMRLQLLNKETGKQSYLTQVSYLATLPNQSPSLSSLLIPPTEKDLNHQISLALHSTEYARQDAPLMEPKTSQERAERRIQQIVGGIQIKQLKTDRLFWQLPLSSLPEGVRFAAIPQYRNGSLYRLDIPSVPEGKTPWIWKEKGGLFLQREDGDKQHLSAIPPLLAKGPLVFDVTRPVQGSSSRYHVKTQLQNRSIETEVGLEELEVFQAEFPTTQGVSWLPVNAEGRVELPINEEKEVGVLLAKSFMDNGVKTGDRGYLSYSSSTSGSLQEQRLPLFVSGFYDPGVLSIGNKCILVPSSVTQTINASSSSFNLDKTQSTGILVWFPSLESTASIKTQIVELLKERELDAYWKVTSYEEYDFAKDLLEQFQSDKTLFMLVGIIILIVGCCNIISMLVLLVNDKAKEIGILQAMGASRLSIAFLFGMCGITMGVISSLLGLGAALFTLEHLDSLVQILSFFQGHDAFNPTFFGASLPKTLSHHAVLFVLLTTPLLALIAGLIPAIKACRLPPSTLLRNE